MGTLSILQELSYLPCALPYIFIFSSETDSMTLRDSKKTGAIFWVMVSYPEIAQTGQKKVAKFISREPMVVET